tara:strand:- start:434 stop:1669 length:1236 start_codon:yes stop_codon:yes gene_type:complete
MNTFTEFLSEAAVGKNTHMMHIEDQVIYGGVSGAREAIFALRSLRDMLAGNSSKAVDITVKWDGAPAVFAGQDPGDGKFFVAKKGIFNKSPKVYKTDAEIDADMSGDLAVKMKVALTELPKLGIKGVVQGDIMFTKKDLKKETIDGESYVTFQPNTIVYTVPVNSDLGKQISKANLGVVFHTAYAGKDFESMTASYDVDASKFKQTPSVWFQDAGLRDISGKALLSAKDTKKVQKALSVAGKIFQKIAGSTLRVIEGNPELAQKIETFNNTFVRKGEEVKNTKKHVQNMIAWVNDKYAKETELRKSEKGKANVAQRRDEFLKFFSQENQANLDLVFQLQNAIVVAKKLIIAKLDDLKKMDTFVRTKNGFRVTGQEGFVVIDKIGGGAVKLVDRLEFSMNNFSPDIIKGWEH